MCHASEFVSSVHETKYVYLLLHFFPVKQQQRQRLAPQIQGQGKPRNQQATDSTPEKLSSLLQTALEQLVEQGLLPKVGRGGACLQRTGNAPFPMLTCDGRRQNQFLIPSIHHCRIGRHVGMYLCIFEIYVIRVLQGSACLYDSGQPSSLAAWIQAATYPAVAVLPASAKQQQRRRQQQAAGAGTGSKGSRTAPSAPPVSQPPTEGSSRRDRKSTRLNSSHP